MKELDIEKIYNELLKELEVADQLFNLQRLTKENKRVNLEEETTSID